MVTGIDCRDMPPVAMTVTMVASRGMREAARHIGAALIEYLLDGEVPAFDADRLRSSTRLLAHDLERQSQDGTRYECDVSVDTPIGTVKVPILATAKNGAQAIIALSGPLTDGYPADPQIARLAGSGGKVPIHLENELVVRRNLPFATRSMMQRTK